MGLYRRIGLAVLIETAIGMVNVDEVAKACPSAGGDDLRRGRLRRPRSRAPDSIGGVDENYSVLTDAETRPRASATGGPVALPARPHRRDLPGARPAPDRRPLRRLHRSRRLPRPARRSAVLGYEGKWRSAPRPGAAGQRGVHTRAAAGRAHARWIVAAMRDAAAEGKGAVSLDGRLNEPPRSAWPRPFAKLEQIEAKQLDSSPSARYGSSGSAASQALRPPLSSQITGKNDSSSARSPRRR